MKVHLKKCDIKSQKKVMKTIFKSIFFFTVSPLNCFKKKYQKKHLNPLLKNLLKFEDDHLIICLPRQIQIIHVKK